jgi:trimethylguanosine synthase
MAKRKKKQNQHQRNQNNNKRRKGERYWIQDCPDLVAEGSVDASIDAPYDLLVWLSEAKLEDEHHKNDVVDSPVAMANANDTVEVTRDQACCSARPAGATRYCAEIASEESQSESLVETEPAVSRHPVIYIQRAPTVDSFKPPARRLLGSNSKPYRPLPNGDCGDGIVNPFHSGDNVVPDKYWAQRKRLFSRFDAGIKLDREGWFSVTPEAIANHIARRMASACTCSTFDRSDSSGGLVLLDAFAGVGGNAIAFANRPEVSLVICVDTSIERLRLAANNCRVYNIPTEKVVFIHGDACRVLAAYKNGARVDAAHKNNETNCAASANTAVCNEDCDYGFGGYERLPSRLDAIFLSPPWGGVDYEQIGPRHFSLSCIQLNDSVDGVELLRLAVAALPADRQNIGYFLPRNLNGMTLAQNCHQCGIRGCIEMEQNILNQKLKTVTVYIDDNVACRTL